MKNKNLFDLGECMLRPVRLHKIYLVVCGCDTGLKIVNASTVVNSFLVKEVLVSAERGGRHAWEVAM